MSIRFRAVATLLAAALMAATLVALPTIILCCLTGCDDPKRAPAAESPAPTHPAPPAPASVGEADKRIAEAQGRADQAQRDLEQARLDLKALHADRDQLVVDVARARLAWTAGLLQLAVIGFGAFAVFSPVDRTWLVYAAVGAEAAAVLALALRLVYAWLPIAGCVVGAAFVAIAIWKVVKLARTARAAADHGERLEQAMLAVPDWVAGERANVQQVLAAVKDESIRKQAAAGVRGWMAAVRGKPVKPAAPAAVPA